MAKKAEDTLLELNKNRVAKEVILRIKLLGT
jgi:hypothetical protein